MHAYNLQSKSPGCDPSVAAQLLQASALAGNNVGVSDRIAQLVLAIFPSLIY